MRALLLVLLLAGCAGQAARDDLERTSSTEFLDAARRAAAPRPAAQGGPAPADGEIRRRMEAALGAIGNAPAAVESWDFESPAAREVRGRAGDVARVREALAARVDLAELIPLAFARNPGIAEALADWTSVAARYEQSAALADVASAYRAFTRELEIPFGPMEGAERPLAELAPPPGFAAKQGDVLDAEVAVARAEYLEEVTGLVEDARKAHAELAWLDAAVEITRANQRILSDLSGVVSIKYQSGSAEYADVLRAQSELDEIEQELITLQTERERSAASIRGLLDLPPDVAIGPAAPTEDAPVATPLAEILEMATLHAPGLAIRRAEIARMEAAIRLASERPWYKYVPAGDREEAPPPTYGLDDAFLREMRLRLDAMRQGIEDETNDVQVEVERTYWEADAGWRRQQLYATSLVAKARQSLEANRAGYEAAHVGFLSVLDAERTLFEAEIEEARARRDLRAARAALDAGVGRPVR